MVFNEGYAATAGEHWIRPALCQDARRLGRLLAALMPREPEVHGLLALMELQASRLRARVGPHGELLPSVRGDLLVRQGRPVEAREEFMRAADLCDNARERELLLSSAVTCGTDGRRGG